MSPEKAKLLDWIKRQMKSVDRNAIIERNKELAEYRDWQKAMNAYMAGKRFYNPEVHGPIIARMYGPNRNVFQRWRDEGYPRYPHRERDFDNPETLAGVMYQEYYPGEYMDELSYPGTDRMIGVGDDVNAADWGGMPSRMSRKEFDRRMNVLDDWYDANFIDPMDLR